MEPRELFALGTDAADELLRRLFRLEVAKAADNVLDEDGFLKITARVSRALKKAAAPAERKAGKRAAEQLDIDWREATAGQRDEAIRQAEDELRKGPDDFMPKVDAVLEVHAEDNVKRTRRAMISRNRLRISASTTERDEATMKLVRETEAFFVRDNYGRVSEALSAQAREVVAAGLEEGLGSADIAADLATVMAKAERPTSYWDVIAMNFSNRGRTFTQIHSLDDAGIEKYRFTAVLDEVTTTVCRFMHGRTFTVGRAAKRIERAMKLENPADIVKVLPWVYEAKRDDGKRVMYFDREDGGRQAVAVVEESGDGNRDDTGSYSRELSTAALERNGVSMPPLHARCRSVVAADV